MPTIGNLYGHLEKQGFSICKYPSDWIDRISEKYKIINRFYKTKYSTDHRILCKGT